jgi:hypothetical protein
MSQFDFSEYCNKRLFEEFPELLEEEKYRKTIAADLQEKYGAHGIYYSGR